MQKQANLGNTVFQEVVLKKKSWGSIDKTEPQLPTTYINTTQNGS
jgi:hypothetical protein